MRCGRPSKRPAPCPRLHPAPEPAQTSLLLRAQATLCASASAGFHSFRAMEWKRKVVPCGTVNRGLLGGRRGCRKRDGCAGVLGLAWTPGRSRQADRPKLWAWRARASRWRCDKAETHDDGQKSPRSEKRRAKRCLRSSDRSEVPLDGAFPRRGVLVLRFCPAFFVYRRCSARSKFE